MLIGYARTSTVEQEASLAAQLKALADYGCEKLFQEQTSAAGQRKCLADALEFAREGDTLVCTKLDRLARSVADLLSIVKQLEGKRVALRILDFGGQALDTKAPTSKLILTVVAAIAQFERELMLERQRVGIQEAKQRGDYKGRAPTARRQTDKVIELYRNGVSNAQIMAQLNISKASFYRILRENRASTRVLKRDA